VAVRACTIVAEAAQAATSVAEVMQALH
jgi:hypothetical protein